MGHGEKNEVRCGQKLHRDEPPIGGSLLNTKVLELNPEDTEKYRRIMLKTFLTLYMKKKTFEVIQFTMYTRTVTVTFKI